MSVAAAVAALLCVSAVSTVAFTMAVVYRLHVPLPYWDEWSTIIHFRNSAEGHYTLGDLAAQHNEHRILFPRLFFFADEMLFSLSGLLNATVTVLLQAANAAILAPHRLRTFKLSRDPKFAEKVRDIVGLYVDPPAHAVVLSVDENSQSQALDRTQPGLPMKKGRAGTMTHDYKRHGHDHPVRRPRRAGGQGHRAMHAATSPSGVHPLPQRRRASGPRRQVRPRHPRQLRYSQTSQGDRLARPPPRWSFHFTPTGASWLNAVGGFFAKRRLKRGVFKGFVDLQTAINRFLADHNKQPKPFTWTADPDKIIAAASRGHQTLDSIH